MQKNATVTTIVSGTDTTIDARFLLGIKSVSGIVSIYKGTSAIAANLIAECEDNGQFMPNFPVIVERVGSVAIPEKIFVDVVATTGACLVYTSQ